MKKTLILIGALMLLTGCGNKEVKKETMSCFFQNTNEGYEFTTNVDIKIEDDIVKDATATMNFTDASLAKTMCDIFKQASDANNGDLVCGETFIVVNNYHKSVNAKEMTKKDFKKYLEDQQFICE